MVSIVTINYKNKQKVGRYFIVPRKDQLLLSMPDIETLNVLTIICNMIDMQTPYEEISTIAVLQTKS